MFFIWNPRNTAHITEHGVTKEEAEFVVRRATPPFPQKKGGGKYVVWGTTRSDRLLQVIYVLRSIEEIGFHELPSDVIMLLSRDEDLYVVIHARDLTENERRQLRRRRRYP
jgi:uncharacterized DUF497 family protein